MAGRRPGALFKSLILAFWAIYFSLIALTNLVNLLDELGAFDWTFLDSNNLDYVASTVDIYGLGSPVAKLLLAGAIALELGGAILFWRALRDSRTPGAGAAALTALAWGVAVWTAFILMTEFFISYGEESTFRELLLLTIASAIALALIPDDAGESRPA